MGLNTDDDDDDDDNVYDVYRHQNREINLAELRQIYSDGDNERVPCSSIPDIDLHPWTDHPTSHHPVQPGHSNDAPSSPSRGDHLNHRPHA